MAPLTPHWAQPSHGDTQEVIINEAEFTSKSLSKTTVPPFGVFAKMDFTPCTVAEGGPTYATVQMGRNKHLNLNSDLLYINHSCEPSLIFDTGNLNILAGPKGLQPGDELTFFYPSTEWSMAQPFDCGCGKPACRGRISGASDMTDAELEGVWLNGHIRELLEERKATQAATATATAGKNGDLTKPSENGVSEQSALPRDTAADQTAQALQDALDSAEKVVEASRRALLSYLQSLQHSEVYGGKTNGGALDFSGLGGVQGLPAAGSQRRGPTSRELSGEMGGDTTILV
ncbi:hypothetical protein B0T22DRAFT_263183 [Podospora appendiculata]|uniref:Post-SET domain-containing protein n=1 Tax=Podospora appendiculata TaxID=314037 RepID=A0AAE0X2X0_9PEZI|nr:hypothetical protein B0T22DRAFT_263183 [Podospora appendiculata]